MMILSYFFFSKSTGVTMSGLINKRRVTFNTTVVVRTIPGRGDVERSTPREPGLVELLMSSARSMNTIDRNIQTKANPVMSGEDEVIQRMAVYNHTRTMATTISRHPSVEHLVCNTPKLGLECHDANLRDKVALDFLHSLMDGVFSKESTGEEKHSGNTVHILLNPRPEELVCKMERCIVLNTTEMRPHGNSQAFQVLTDVCLDA